MTDEVSIVSIDRTWSKEFGSPYRCTFHIFRNKTSFFGVNGETLAEDVAADGHMLSEEQKKVIQRLKKITR